MANTATLTGNTGPGGTVTGLLLGDVSSIKFDFRAGMISVIYGDVDKEFNLSYTGVTTVTFSISGVSTTVTVS
jgi:hypothetical protein